MRIPSTRIRIATLAAAALAAGAIAVPTATACPVDPYGQCLVVSPDRDKAVKAKAKAKAKPAKATLARSLDRPSLRGGR